MELKEAAAIGEALGQLLREHPGAFALLGVRYLLLLVGAVALIRLCRRAGHGWGWSLLALLPLIAYPFAYCGIILGFVTPEEAEWLSTPLLAILPIMVVRLALRRWPTAMAGHSG